MGRLPEWRPLKRLFAIVVLSLISLVVFLWLLRTSFFDNSAPTVQAANPSSSEFGISVSTPIRVTFRKPMRPNTINSSTIRLRDSEDRIVPATVIYRPDTHSATLKPATPLEHSATYKVTVDGGPAGVQDRRGRTLASDLSWSFTTGAPPASPPSEGPGGPILVVCSSSNLFSRYYAEILRNEGLNEFAVLDISLVTAAKLKEYDIVILGEFPLDREQIEMFVDWVREGGNLIAMRPDKRLAEQVGLKDIGAVLRDGYLSINTNQEPGIGLVNETLQFHGPADLYESHGTTTLSTLYRDATAATGSPAVVLKKLGSGQLAAFTYDLARSVAYTRQGNPAWAETERDGIPPMRSDDLFYGPAVADPKPNWVDLSKVAIPQADIQQRFLVNLTLYMNFRKKPLPRFWYFPHGFKAIVIMTGDDHGHGGTLGRFLALWAKDRPNCSLANWECVRATSNIYSGTISDAQAADLTREGFEIGLHLYTKCLDWPKETVTGPGGTAVTRISWSAADALYARQLAEFRAAYPDLPAPRTSRVDCVTWGDYDTQPQVELQHGIRLDTNYYYWPPKWVDNQPGMFTGSGMPMRFAKLDGGLIDVYQAATQMTDESGQTYPFTIDALLSKALGPEEYYGAFTANMHTDYAASAGSDAIIAAAQARRVPIVSAKQMLTWLDGRNGSSFQKMSWDRQNLDFTISVGEGGNGIRTMLPTKSVAGTLNEIMCDHKFISYTTRVVSGVEYAEFSSPPGNCRAAYSSQKQVVNSPRKVHAAFDRAAVKQQTVMSGAVPVSHLLSLPNPGNLTGPDARF